MNDRFTSGKKDGPYDSPMLLRTTFLKLAPEALTMKIFHIVLIVLVVVFCINIAVELIDVFLDIYFEVADEIDIDHGLEIEFD